MMSADCRFLSTESSEERSGKRLAFFGKSVCAVSIPRMSATSAIMNCASRVEWFKVAGVACVSLRVTWLGDP